METASGLGSSLIFPLKISVGYACFNVPCVYYFQAWSLQHDEHTVFLL